ncbi:hypothetical protein X975_18563, partial [Stegodyphus mimosarum]
MRLKMMIILYAFVLLTIFFVTAIGLLEFGSCSTKCQNSLSDTSASRIFPLRHCSCSQSCAIYGDCCYDSSYRTQASISRRIGSTCLQVHGKGGFQAISTCSPKMKEMDLICSSSISSTLHPVTSRISGVTYANIYCAICNDDYDLQHWNVEYRCQQQNIPKDLSSFKWWHQDRDKIVSSQKKEHCEYYAQNDDFTFLDSLELRPCLLNSEIFRCSLSWRNRSVSQLCQSYSDPVYVNSKLYKNLHCAECNYEILTWAKCQPAIVETLVDEGMTAAEILQICKEGEFEDCLNYLYNDGRGKEVPFRFLFNVHGKMCIPEANKICCEGEKYDPRSKMCRPYFSGRPIQ